MIAQLVQSRAFQATDVFKVDCYYLEKELKWKKSWSWSEIAHGSTYNYKGVSLGTVCRMLFQNLCQVYNK